ncbi:hypothetical protein [Gordonia sp. (in: high G+C Gram-positive bacteria)]|uniref:hypothetical protein n=1 Tax=Gordonia sp. (in: high G+C Gram-positive bacteria) TaxID=84139 RepID=UPI0039E3CA17
MRGSPIVRRVALAAAALLVALAAFAGVRYFSSAPKPPGAPTGVAGVAKVGHVEVTWRPVEGADDYLLIRDDLVVADGPEPRGVDATVTKGKHAYRVQASTRGVPSPMSAPVQVEAGEGWGAGAPLVALLPRLLPAAPKTDGPWEKLHCNWQIKPGRNELGPSETGAGPVGMRNRLMCGSKMKWGLHAMWFYSKDAVDGYLRDVIPDAQAFRWNHGSGFFLTSRGEGYLKFDDPRLSLIVLGINRTDSTAKDPVVQMANQLPI